VHPTNHEAFEAEAVENFKWLPRSAPFLGSRGKITTETQRKVRKENNLLGSFSSRDSACDSVDIQRSVHAVHSLLVSTDPQFFETLPHAAHISDHVPIRAETVPDRKKQQKKQQITIQVMDHLLL